ncbi:hypothetical protein V5799_032393 [Amblyomma americanum]|uniref:Tick transposon n=1 Tax=Amblyomma americanum TaxID=6943 RepID=A0AAQ4DRA4_AMBAM
MQRLVNQDAHDSYLGPSYHTDLPSQWSRRFPTYYRGPQCPSPQDDVFPSLRCEPYTTGKTRIAVGNIALIMPIDRVTQVRNLNALQVSRELDSIVPDGIRSVRLNWKLNLFAVDTLKPEVTATLMGLRRLCGVPVEVQEPRSSFKAVGVVYGIQPGMTATDIEACVRSTVPVLSVRIPSPPSPAIMIFASCRIPERVIIGFVQYRVKLYVDRPPRCRLCGGIGHVAAVCRKPYACRRCGAAHDTSLCPAPRLRCLNCGRDHDSRSKACPRWLQMLEVSRYKRLNDVDLETAKAAVVASSKTREGSDISSSNKEAIRRLNSALADATDSKGGRMRIEVLADKVEDASRNSGRAADRKVYTVEELLKIGSRVKDAAKGTRSGQRPSTLGVAGRIARPFLKAVITVVGILGRLFDDIERACYRCLDKFQPNDDSFK